MFYSDSKMIFISLARFNICVFLCLTVLASVGCSGGDDSTNNGAGTRPFITTWKTDNIGATANNQIMISTSGGGYNYTIDWGDGEIDTQVTGDITHTYANPGTYTVSISGDFPRIFFVDDPNFLTFADSAKLISIEQWGDIKWQSMRYAFLGCINLVGNADDVPDLSQVTDMSGMYYRVFYFNQDISAWDVSSVTNMSEMFNGAWSFNGDISAWDVSSVTNMSGMFAGASGFNRSLSDWDVSSVTDMGRMFTGASRFNQVISAWDISSVVNMSGMFFGATAFNQDISAWDVSSVTDMSDMFQHADAFNQNISSWNVSSVTDMNYMFKGTDVFNQNISAWDVSAVTNMSNMFEGAFTFNQDISAWDVSSVTNMSGMFFQASSFNQDLSAWNVSSVTDMRGMFDQAILSIANYDALLLGWSAQSLQSGVIFSAGNSQYSSSSQAARDTLTNAFLWTITDGGVAP